MKGARILNLAHHRSKERIKSLGEVFTPEKYVFQMLDMLDKPVWSDLDAMFFEPTCGHGNFVVAIVQKRLEHLIKKVKRQKIKKPHFYAVAHTLNNLWAIDIDSENIRLCRDRVCHLIFNFLWEHEKSYRSKPTLNTFIKRNKEYLTHVLCAVQYQIHTNEALSCLESDYNKAQKASSKTLVSQKWFQNHKHRPIDFDKTWAIYFKICQQKGIIPIEYRRNLKSIEKVVKMQIAPDTEIKINKRYLQVKEVQRMVA